MRAWALAATPLPALHTDHGNLIDGPGTHRELQRLQAASKTKRRFGEQPRSRLLCAVQLCALLCGHHRCGTGGTRRRNASRVVSAERHAKASGWDT
jgi:hypothetical protein